MDATCLPRFHNTCIAFSFPIRVNCSVYPLPYNAMHSLSYWLPLNMSWYQEIVLPITTSTWYHACHWLHDTCAYSGHGQCIPRIRLIVIFVFGCWVGCLEVHSVDIYSFWVVYLVQFSHTHLEVDFRHTAMPPMRIASCAVDGYIAADTKDDAAAITVSVYVRWDEPRCDKFPATMLSLDDGLWGE